MLRPRRHGLAMGYACKLPRPWQNGFSQIYLSRLVSSPCLSVCSTHLSLSLCGFGKHACDTMWTLNISANIMQCTGSAHVAAGNPNCSHCCCCTCCCMWDTQHRSACSCLLHACARGFTMLLLPVLLLLLLLLLLWWLAAVAAAAAACGTRTTIQQARHSVVVPWSHGINILCLLVPVCMCVRVHVCLHVCMCA